MYVPVAPRIVRRVVRDPLYVVACVAIIVVLYVVAAVLLLFAPFTRRRRALRIVVAGAAAVWLDCSLVLGCWRLWFLHRIGRRDASTWRADHVALLGQRLRSFFLAGKSTVGFRADITTPDGPIPVDRPLLVLSRHAGPADSLLMAYIVSDVLGLAPRIVLKHILLWDAGMDLLLGRLGAFFLPSPRVPAAERRAMLSRFAASVEPGEAMLVFPEGKNWTPGRHADALAEARDDGDVATASWIEAHPTVLPPADGGTRTTTAARPDVRWVVAAHRGLEQMYSVAQIWRALPLQQPVEVVLTAYEPPPDAGVATFLFTRWGDIDDWSRDGALNLPA